ncbi:MAG: transposase [Cytophagaceae bacterium]
MPNHIHLIWELHKMNGKEYPHESFMKFTGHEFKKLLKQKDEETLNAFKVDSITREFQFWKRDSLPVELYSRSVIEQKLDYIHANPVQPQWNLVEDIVDYHYSSASFYELDIKSFTFLRHYMDRI